MRDFLDDIAQEEDLEYRTAIFKTFSALIPGASDTDLRRLARRLRAPRKPPPEPRESEAGGATQAAG